MRVEIGNDHAIESYYTEEGKLAYKSLPGEQTTTFTFPEGTTSHNAFVITLNGLKRHMERGAKPAWIESDDKTLRKLLVNHFGLQITKANRPQGWGT